MLDNNDRKYILRRIITYIAIAMIILLLSSCNVKAITTEALDLNTIINVDTDYKTVTINKFRSAGVGTIIFTIDYFNPGSQVASADSLIREITLYTSNNDAYECKIGNTMGYRDNNVYHNVLSVECPINLPSDVFLYQIKFRRTSAYGTSEGAMMIRTSEWATFIDSSSVQDMSSAINNVNNSVNNVNNSLNDSSSPSSSDISGSASDWNSNNAESGVINQLVLMPITLLNSFVNGINGSCSPYDVGELWGEHIIFPCINLSQTLGSVWTIIDVILSGMFIFIFGKRCVKIFNDFTNLRSGQIDTLYGGDN